MAAAFVCYLIGRKKKTLRDHAANVFVGVEFLLALYMFVSYRTGAEPVITLDWFAGLGIRFVMDGFRSLYALVAAFMWLATTVFSKEYLEHYRNRNRYYLFVLITLGATMGVFLSADLYTTFIFFEIMSFTSYVWVAQDEKPKAMRAAETYLAVAVIGGMVMLMGLFLLYHMFGELTISELPYLAQNCDDPGLLFAASICLAVGFGAKAGAFPLHIWLPKAHPVAPAPASALLSGILTKSGIYGLVIVSLMLEGGNETWGKLMLGIGLVTMFQGALLALFSNDLKKTLACSSVSQIGFILVGIGMSVLLGSEENALAVRGTLLHMVNHSLFKLVLFMVAGVIFMNLHKLDLNEIRGYGRKKTWLALLFLSGGLGISGVPFFSGYVSKTLLHESIVEYAQTLSAGGQSAMEFVEWVFLISGGMTFAYMTKLFIAIFVEENADKDRQKNYEQDNVVFNLPSRLAITIPALLIPVMGVGTKLMDLLADRGMPFFTEAALMHSVSYFSAENLKGSLISLGIGLGIYLVFVRLLMMRKDAGVKVYQDLWPAWMDLENTVYRPLIKVVCAIGAFFSRVCDSAVDAIVVGLRKTIYTDAHLQFELAEGTWLTYHMGRFLNRLQVHYMLRHPHKEIKHKDYVHALALGRVRFLEDRFVISRSLSFGLLLLSLGFIVTTVYLLGVHW
ncbi:MAG: complex I subunit 5 family protein [Lachnospiraceae bacterium]|nr:complex I subunit 5 family protein [Lachnospiraceae bacterium]